MNNMEKRQKNSQNLMTVFTVSVFALPLILFAYQTSQAMFAPWWAFFGYLTFTLTVITGLLGLYLTLNLHVEIEKDIIQKMKLQYPNFRVTRIDYNYYKLEEKVSEVYLERGFFGFSLSKNPTSQIEIDLDKKLVFYK